MRAPHAVAVSGKSPVPQIEPNRAKPEMFPLALWRTCPRETLPNTDVSGSNVGPAELRAGDCAGSCSSRSCLHLGRSQITFPTCDVRSLLMHSRL